VDGTPFGHYTLLDLLGRGGMGQVYRAHDTVTDRVVALKVLPPSVVDDPVFKERFRREAHAAAGLRDPHVVPIHGYGEIDGQLYLDMRLIDGEDLATVLTEAKRPLTPERAVKVIEQVAAALDAAHEVGLVHRDVKPSNIFLAERDFVYLIDFGISRTVSQTGLTSVGSTLGTMAYMAPERFKDGHSDPRSDTYALTCVLYQCLTGRLPYPGDTLEQQLTGHLVTPTPRPSSVNRAVPQGFDDVIAKGMAKDADKRYQSAGELAEAVKAVMANQPTGPVKRGPAHGRPPRPANRKRTLVISGAALAVILTVALAAWLLRGAAGPSGAGDGSATALPATSSSPTSGLAPPITDPAAIAATVPDEIRASGKLVIGIDTPYAPAEFTDGDGNYTGFGVELMNAVAKTLNLTPEYQETVFDSIIPSIQSGVFNVGLSSFTDNKEREKDVDFVTYFQAGTQWAQRPDTPVKPNDACGKKVGVASRTIQDLNEIPAKSKECVDSGKPEILKTDYISQDDVTNALLTGEVDAMSADFPVTGYAVKNSHGALETTGGIFDAAPYGWPVAKGSPLAESLRQALMHVIATGEYAQIMKKWDVQAGMIATPAINGAYN
jgi:ABC-type amino acid transport substrate-binding protein/predicted Ser/Thr protein kinase